VAVIGSTAVPASQPGARRLQSDVNRAVGVTGAVHPPPGGRVLESANGRYAFEGKERACCIGRNVVVSGRVKTPPGEKGPRRTLVVSRVGPAGEKRLSP
jgi:hypothetical protein